MITIRELRQMANPDLRIEGVVLTMYEPAIICQGR